MNGAEDLIVGLETPAFLVDAETVLRNARRFIQRASDASVVLRPHVKTHKTIEGALLQCGGAPGPITVSTLAEAEFYADNRFDDITYAVPIAPARIARAAGLAKRVKRLNLVVDHPDTVQALETYARAHDLAFDVFLKVDCGYHRAGVDPDSGEAFDLAGRILESSALQFRGLLTHGGHSYRARNVAEIREVAREERDAVIRLATRIGASDLTLSIGSTPTISVETTFDGIDEIRPGNYIFYDAFQATIGSCRLEDVAVSVLATVIGSYPDQRRIVIDAGALALSKDPGATHVTGTVSYGIVAGIDARPLEGLDLVALSQEHGEIRVAPEADPAAIRIGSRLRIYPNHSCLTAALHDLYHVIEGDGVIDQWRPVRGW